MPDPVTGRPPHEAFLPLRRFVRPPRKVVERCELCGVALPELHQHLVEPDTRKLLCACQGCSLLFDGDAVQKYRRIPRTMLLLRDFQIVDADWDRLMIPINLAFFFYSSPLRRMVAMYPSPAGPVESLLEPSAWEQIAANCPRLADLKPDVEALLVNRMGERYGFPIEKDFLASIDQCYRLVGLMRANWRGLSGGQELWDSVRRFFEESRRTAIAVHEVQHA